MINTSRECLHSTTLQLSLAENMFANNALQEANTNAEQVTNNAHRWKKQQKSANTALSPYCSSPEDRSTQYQQKTGTRALTNDTAISLEEHTSSKKQHARDQVTDRQKHQKQKQPKVSHYISAQRNQHRVLNDLAANTSTTKKHRA